MRLKSRKIIKRGGRVFDLTVKKNHNFLVTEGSLVVHNSYCENLLADNPIHGPGQNSIYDLVLIGEGEMMDLKLFQRYYQVVTKGGGSKEDFLDGLDNEHHQGVYDPTKVLFEYADKEHVIRDFTGKVLKRQLWPKGGPIKNIYMIDEENKTLHALAGNDSEEFRDLEPMAKMARVFVDNPDKDQIASKYVKARKVVPGRPMTAKDVGTMEDVPHSTEGEAYLDKLEKMDEAPD